MAIERKTSRQEFLKFAAKFGLGAAALTTGCTLSSPETAQSSSPTPLKLSAAEKLATAQVEATKEAKFQKTKIEPSPVAKATAKEQPTYGLKWQSEIKLPSKTGWFSRTPDTFFTSENSVFVADKDGYPIRLSLASGQVTWRWEDEADIWGMDSKMVYVMRPDMRFFALDIGTGKTKWSVIFPKETNSFVEWPISITNPAVHITTSSRYITTTHNVVTIDKAIGRILWQSQEDLRIAGNTNKTLVVAESGLTNGFIKGLNLLDATPKWTLNTTFQNPLPPDYNISGNVLIYPLFLDKRDARNRTLAAIDIDSGNKLWEGKESIIGLIKTSEQYLYAKSNNDLLLILNLNSGALVKEIPQFNSYKGDFVGEVQNIAVVSFESTGFTRLIDLSTGKEAVNDDLRVNRVLGVWDDTLIALYYDLNSRRPRFLYGIDSKTAKRKYRTTLPDIAASVNQTQDKIILSNRSGFMVYSTNDVSLIADYSTTSLRGNVQSLRVNNDMVFVITNYNNIIKLYTFKI